LQREVLAERIAARAAEIGHHSLSQQQIEQSARLLLPVLIGRRGVIVSPVDQYVS
jgi:hypothetical protein